MIGPAMSINWITRRSLKRKWHSKSTADEREGFACHSIEGSEAISLWQVVNSTIVILDEKQ
jgi:hypothetical protein